LKDKRRNWVQICRKCGLVGEIEIGIPDSPITEVYFTCTECKEAGNVSDKYDTDSNGDN